MIEEIEWKILKREDNIAYRTRKINDYRFTIDERSICN